MVVLSWLCEETTYFFVGICIERERKEILWVISGAKRFLREEEKNSFIYLFVSVQYKRKSQWMWRNWFIAFALWVCGLILIKKSRDNSAFHEGLNFCSAFAYTVTFTFFLRSGSWDRTRELLKLFVSFFCFFVRSRFPLFSFQRDGRFMQFLCSWLYRLTRVQKLLLNTPSF